MTGALRAVEDGSLAAFQSQASSRPQVVTPGAGGRPTAPHGQADERKSDNRMTQALAGRVGRA